MPHLLEQATVLVLAQQSRGLSMGLRLLHLPTTYRHQRTCGGRRRTGPRHQQGHRQGAGGPHPAPHRRGAAMMSPCWSWKRPRPSPRCPSASACSAPNEVSAWGFPRRGHRRRSQVQGPAGRQCRVPCRKWVYFRRFGQCGAGAGSRHHRAFGHGVAGQQRRPRWSTQAGQVVGINTFIKLDGESYRQSSIAVVSSAVARLLQQWKIPYLEARPAEAAPQPSGDGPEGGRENGMRRARARMPAPPAAPAAPKESRTAPAGV